MMILLKNSLGSLKKRFFQYLGLILLLTLTVSIFSALFANVSQLSSKYNLLYYNSARETNFISRTDIDNIDLVYDGTTDLFPGPIGEGQYQNNNRALLARLSHEEKNNFSCKRELFAGGYLDPLLCEIHRITFNNRFDDNFEGYQVASIKQWRLLRAYNEDDNLKSVAALIYSSSVFENNQTMILHATYDLDNSFQGLLNNVNPVTIVKGRAPLADDEIVINETYAYSQKINLNSIFKIGNLNYKVVGIGNSYTTRRLIIYGGFGTTSRQILDSRENTTVFMTTAALTNNRLKQYTTTGNFSMAAIILAVPNADSVTLNALKTNRQLRQKMLLDKVADQNWIGTNNDVTIGNIQIQVVVFTLLIIVVMGAIVMIVCLFISKEIKSEQRTIGNLKAFGYNSWQIAFNYIGIIFIVSVISSMLAIGFSAIFQRALFSGIMRVLNVGIISIYFDPLIIVLFFFIIPLIFTFITYLLVTFLLRVPALKLLNPQSSSKNYRFLLHIKLLFQAAPFNLRLSVAFFSKSFIKWAISVFILFLTSFILFLQFLTFDTINKRIDNLFGEWNTSSMIEYDNQYRNSTDYDQFKKNPKDDPTKPSTKGYYYQQQFEYIPIQKISYPNRINKALPYNIVDLKINTPAVSQKKSTIYRVFNASDNSILDNILFKITRILNTQPNIDFEEIRDFLSSLELSTITDWLDRFATVNDGVKEKYKFNISSETIAVLLKYKTTILALNEKITDFLETQENSLIRLARSIELLSNFGIKINNLELTFNYVAYDNTQDYLATRYNYEFENQATILKTNSSVNGHFYGFSQNTFENVLNISNPKQYLEALHFKDLNKFRPHIDPIPVLISKSAAKYSENNYKVGDIVQLKQFSLNGTNKIKIVGIIDSSNNQWNIVTNQEILRKFYELREITNPDPNNLEYENTTFNLDGNENFLNQHFNNYIMTTSESIQPLRSFAFYCEQPSYDIITRIMAKNSQNSELQAITTSQPTAQKILAVKPIINTSGIFIKRIAKNIAGDILNSFINILNIVRYVTIAIVAVVLTLLVSMIIDDNLFIIATMKILGYKIREIVTFIIGWYLAGAVIFFCLGIGLAYLTWFILETVILNMTGFIFAPYIAPLSLFITFFIIASILIITYIFAIGIIKRKDILILQKTS